MKYAVIKGLEDEKFRRLTGVKRTTFEKMVEILSDSDKKKRAKGGRKPKLLIEDGPALRNLRCDAKTAKTLDL